MTHTDLDQNMTSLVHFAFEHPPLNRSKSLATYLNDLRFDTSPPIVNLQVGGLYHPIIGITSAGWVMSVGIGWRVLVDTDSNTREAIALTCNHLQSKVLEDRERFLKAMSAYWDERILTTPDTRTRSSYTI